MCFTEPQYDIAFFFDNRFLLKHRSVHSAKKVTEMTKSIHTIENNISNNTSSMGPPTGWNENAWTRRLVASLQKAFSSKCSVVYTAEFEINWEVDLLPKLGLKSLARNGFFLLRGAPGVLINTTLQYCLEVTVMTTLVATTWLLSKTHISDHQW